MTTARKTPVAAATPDTPVAPAGPARLVIASRQSRLAMWQAEHVQARLRAMYPACEVAILGMTTEGDRVLDRALNEIGGKGLFIKELEVALLERRADLAVHSLKDVPLRTRSGPSTSAYSTTPVAAPAMSYSSGASRPGCSAVSPPTRATRAWAHAAAMPPTMAATRSGPTSNGRTATR